MSEDAFEKALEGLQSPRDKERKEAVFELIRMKDRRAVDVLARTVGSELDLEVRCNARKGYYLLMDIFPSGWEEPPLDLPIGISLDDLEWFLNDDNPRIRGEGIKLGAKMDPGSVVPLIRMALAKEKHPQLQSALLMIIGRMGSHNDIEDVARFLPAEDPKLRVIAIETLNQLGGHDALMHIIPLLQDPDKNARAAASKAIQPLSSEEMLKILKKMALSANMLFRDAAIFTLQRFKAPMASAILGHLAAVDPDPGLQAKAKVALESMSQGDEAAKKALEKLAAAQLAAKMEDPSYVAPVAPAVTTPGTGEPPPPPPPEEIPVPGIPQKLVRDLIKGDPTVREAALKKIAPLLKPDHASFLLARLEKEPDPRISSYLLSLLGKTKAPQAYAAVIKKFKDPDDRVKANAIEAAFAIDPVTTPDRITGFLSDKNNRVRANSIIVCATRPDFDPLVWVRDLAAFGDPAFRRSALYVINLLKRPTFLEVLETLLEDCEMEIRGLAYVALQDFVNRKVPGSHDLFERASARMSKEQKAAGKFDQDFHTAMNAMRAPPPPKRPSKKDVKSAGQELGEQLLGEDGLKKAGQTVKNLQAQAKQARDRMTESLAKSLAGRTLKEKIGLIVYGCLLGLLLLLHLIGALGHLQDESILRLIYLGAAGAAVVLSLAFWKLSGPGPAAGIALILLLVPLGASRLGLGAPEGDPQPVSDGTPAGATGTSQVTPPKPTPTRVVTTPAQPKGSQATIKILAPTSGAVIEGDFPVKARAGGKVKSVQFFLDNTPLQTFEEERTGEFELAKVSSSQYPSGSHVIKVRVTDPDNKTAEEMILVKFPFRLPEITIISPANGGVFWRDDRFSATVEGADFGDIEFVLDGTVIRAYPAEEAGKLEYPFQIATLTVGKHQFEVRTTLPDERVASSSVSFSRLIPTPVVRFASPKNGQEVFGTLDVVIEAESGYKETALRGVTWYVDGNLRQSLATPPFQDSWDLNDVELGPHELRAIAENELGTSSEAVVRVNAIKPSFSVAIKGIRSGQVLQEDTAGTVEVVNEFPGTKIDKVVMSIDDKPFHEETKPPFPFTVPVSEVLPGPRKLVVEAFRSDKKSFQASIPFSVNPKNRVGIYVSAKDPKGEALSSKDLQSVKLELKEDGRNVGSLTMQPGDSIPACFGIILDVSASMKADKKLAKAKEGAGSLLDGLQGADKSFLLKFSDSPTVVQGFTNDKTKVQQELEYLKAERGSALMDAVFMGIDRSSENPDRTVLVVVADGGDENNERTGPASKRGLQETIEFAKKANVLIYCLGVGNALQSAVSDGEKEMQSIARATGGRFVAVPSAADLPQAFRGVLREVREQTKISFQSPSGAHDGRWHALELTAPEKKELQLFYKPGFHGK